MLTLFLHNNDDEDDDDDDDAGGGKKNVRPSFGHREIRGCNNDAALAPLIRLEIPLSRPPSSVEARETARAIRNPQTESVITQSAVLFFFSFALLLGRTALSLPLSLALAFTSTMLRLFASSADGWRDL